MTLNLERQLKKLMQETGIETTAPILADGDLHRFRVEGDRAGTLNGWYLVFPDTYSCVFGCWKRGIYMKTGFSAQKFSAPKTKATNSSEKKSLTPHEQAADIWNSAIISNSQHGYLRKKSVLSFGLKYRLGALLVPVFDFQKQIYGLQQIYPNGQKRFLNGTDKKGHFYTFGSPVENTVLICEGYATAASLHMATGYEMAVAFDANNLKSVAIALRQNRPGARLIMCADADVTGIEAARNAAASSKAEIKVPRFGYLSAGKDWNDLHVDEGIKAVRSQMEEVGVRHV